MTLEKQLLPSIIIPPSGKGHKVISKQSEVHNSAVRKLFPPSGKYSNQQSVFPGVKLTPMLREWPNRFGLFGRLIKRKPLLSEKNMTVHPGFSCIWTNYKTCGNDVLLVSVSHPVLPVAVSSCGTLSWIEHMFRWHLNCCGNLKWLVSNVRCFWSAVLRWFPWRRMFLLRS